MLLIVARVKRKINVSTFKRDAYPNHLSEKAKRGEEDRRDEIEGGTVSFKNWGVCHVQLLRF